MEDVKWILTTLYLTWIAICDWRKCRIPIVSLILGALGAGGIVLWEYICGAREPASIVLGMLPAFFMLVVSRVTGKVGYADGIVLWIIGVLYGYANVIFLMCISMLLLAGLCGILLVLKRASGNTLMPYIPFLAITFILRGRM